MRLPHCFPARISGQCSSLHRIRLTSRTRREGWGHKRNACRGGVYDGTCDPPTPPYCEVIYRVPQKDCFWVSRMCPDTLESAAILGTQDEPLRKRGTKMERNFAPENFFPVAFPSFVPLLWLCLVNKSWAQYRKYHFQLFY